MGLPLEQRAADGRQQALVGLSDGQVLAADQVEHVAAQAAAADDFGGDIGRDRAVDVAAGEVAGELLGEVVNAEGGGDQGLQLLVELLRLRAGRAGEDADAGEDLQRVGVAAVFGHAALDVGIGCDAVLLGAAGAEQGVGVAGGQLHAGDGLAGHEHDGPALRRGAAG